MKKETPVFLYILLFLACNLQAQTYVKHDATGANNGSSWENAYVDLEVALTNSTEGGQVWVAAGTYKPGGIAPSIDAFFTFPHDLELYGGFIGTETMLSERNWSMNETTLSGDHNGDDIFDNYTDNRADNSKHVFWLTDTVTNASVLNGFIISGGNTLAADGSGNNRRGGGILTYGAPIISSCYFTQNYGYFGGSIYPRGTAAGGVVIEDCIFERNLARFGAGIYLNATTGTVENCTFENNTSVSLGGGFYNNSAEGTIINNCIFTNNRSLETRGGGLYNTTSPSTITNCTFTNNTASASSGGGMQVRNTSDDEIVIIVNVSDCTFSDNFSTFGGAFGSYDRNTIVNISNCLFENNVSVNVGGALSNAFGAWINIDNCTFMENQSNTGGAIYSQNDSAQVSVINSHILLNTAEEIGGGIAIAGDGDPSTTATIPIPLLTVENTYFRLNIGMNQGGGINVSNSNMNLTNVLMDNSLTFDGIGGAISLNTTDTITTSFSIINSTITNSSAAVGAGIAHWKPGAEASSELIIQNTILNNPSGDNYTIEDGDPTLVSNGGNLSSDTSLLAYFINTNDLNDTDPLFVDFDDEDLHILPNSPCINTGISDGAPVTDIEGLGRVGEIDMGAFENQNPVGVSTLIISFGQLKIFPNPVQNNLSFNFETSWQGTINIRIVSMDGKVLLEENVDKYTRFLSQTYKVNNLPSGQYELIITGSEGQLRQVESFVKL